MVGNVLDNIATHAPSSRSMDSTSRQCILLLHFVLLSISLADWAPNPLLNLVPIVGQVYHRYPDIATPAGFTPLARASSPNLAYSQSRDPHLRRRMPRMTRAKAAQVAEHLHVDEDVVLEMSERESGGVELMNSTLNRDVLARKPLGEITPNSGEKKSGEDQSTPIEDDEPHQSQHKASAKSKKNEQKAKRGKDTASATASPTSAPEIVEVAPETIVNEGLVTEPSTSTMQVRAG
nr:hypothetical protein CFP56_23876 [Quercus suber]